MRSSTLMFWFLAAAAQCIAMSAQAIDSVTDPAIANEEAVCKVTVDRVGDAMPAGRYRGQCVDGKPNGFGEVTFNNGDRFSGEFKSGRIHGNGTWTSGTSGNTYAGSWRNGKRAGEGTYNWGHGAQQYIGEWADDKRQGQGKFIWANGDRFEGEFRNNQQYTGTFYTAGGKVHPCYMGLCR